MLEDNMIVKNISNTLQILYDKGKTIYLEPGKSIEMVNPPQESWIFKVTKTEEKEEVEENIQLKRRNK
jgi:hypothetical protein